MKIKENLENIKEIEKEEDEEKYNIEDNNKISINKDNNIKLIRDIGFIKRTILTNTHRNIVDDHIESLSTWKINKFRKILTIVGYFLSLGILFFITLYDNTIILKLYCDKANPEDSDYILITDYNNKKYLVTLISEILTSINPLLKMGYKNESKMLEIPFNSKYINKNDEKRFVNIYFIFKNVRYIYNSDFCYFSSAYFNLNGYKNNEILRLFDKKYNIDIKNKEITLQDEENENVYYPSLEEYNYLINKYGLNQILNESTELSSIILKQIFTGFNYFSIICEFIWFFIGYRIFAIIIFLFNLIVLIKSTKDSYLLNKRIYELDKDNNISQENNKEGIPDKNNLALNDANSLINNKQKNNEDKLIKETSIRQINPDLIDIIDNIEQMWSIVPGEVIKIKPGHKILFDGIILNGYCTVDESELTGETNEIYKTQIPNDNEYFQYPNSKNHFLFQGTIIKQCTNDNNNDILRVLVINTGMNTNRANLLLNLSFPKQENYSLNKDTFIYMLIMFIIFIGAIIFNIKLKLSVRYYFSDITIILSPILIISLSISSTFYKYYLEKNGVHCVDKNKIIVAGKSNVIALDKTGTLTENEFDLYGYQFTMPEEYSNNIYNTEIEAKNVNKKYINIPRKSFNISRQSELNNNKSIFGSISNINLNFISSKAQNQLDKTKSQKKLPKLNYDDEQNTVLSHLETSSKVLNKIHQTFWKDFSLKKDDSYKEDFKYNIIYFAECLGCCHNIEKFEDKNLGDAIDIKMFESVNWMIQNEEDKETHEIKRYIMPSNIFKITEKSFFKNLMKNLDKNKKNKNIPILTLPQYKILIEKIYPFNSENQTTTVITKNILDKSRRIYIKGAPEKILEKCTKSSKPENINNLIMDLTKKGLRVIACATRLLDQQREEEYKDNIYRKQSNTIFNFNNKSNHLKKNQSLYEKEFNPIDKENNLTFLGLVIFKNPLKRDTQSVIEKLYNAKFKLVMSTGDNECTSYYVAQESKMVNTEIHSRYVIDIKLDSNLLYMIELKSNNNSDNNESESDIDNYDINEIDNILNKPKDDYLETNNCLDQIDKILQKKEALVSVSGSALSYIMDQLKNDTSSDLYIDISKKCTKKNMDNLIRKFGCIFYRMTPKNKAELIQFFKQDKKSIVIMCGDGSNDVPAILEADIGVSINQESNMQILSHFYMKNTSIECVESIVKTGRACFECNEMLFKVMIIQDSVITLGKKLILSYNDEDLNQYHILLIGLICSLIPLICSIRTSPALILAKEAMGTSLFNKKFLISTGIQLVLNLGVLISFFFYLKNFISDKKILSTYGNNIIFISYMFIFLCFQYILIIFIFNCKSVHRKHFSTNSILIIILLLIILLIIQFLFFAENIDAPWIKALIQFEDAIEEFDFYSELNKLIIQSFVIVNLVLSLANELFIISKL
jgi:magnesium-transporting ATPase (P-type)